MAVKTLYSVGCSFMSDDVTDQGSPTFLEQFAERNGFEYHCIARPGATNWCIRLQIDHAIRSGADFIVAGATSSDRLNIVMNPDGWRSPVELKHMDYQGYRCTSEQEFDNSEAFIHCDTLANLVEGPYRTIPDDKREAVELYIRELHDMGLQYNIDGCVIRDGLQTLRDSGIPFVFIPGPTFYMGWSYLGDNLWPTTEKQPWDMPLGPHGNNNHNPPEAHTMFLETLEKMVVDRNILNK